MIPKIMFTNYKKEFSNIDLEWRLFSFKKYWFGRLIKISIKHLELTLDFRGNMIQDIVNKIET